MRPYKQARAKPRYGTPDLVVEQMPAPPEILRGRGRGVSQLYQPTSCPDSLK